MLATHEGLAGWIMSFVIFYIVQFSVRTYKKDGHLLYIYVKKLYLIKVNLINQFSKMECLSFRIGLVPILYDYILLRQSCLTTLRKDISQLLKITGVEIIAKKIL